MLHQTKYGELAPTLELETGLLFSPLLACGAEDWAGSYGSVRRALASSARERRAVWQQSSAPISVERLRF